jgi:hypothetical protein
MGVGVAILLTAAGLTTPGLVPLSARADSPICSLSTTERIVAVGDVHGAFDQFAGILQAARVIDADHHWMAGRTILVQTGDVTDRGPDSRKALDLLRQLEGEAPKAGGQVYALIGNHEAMWAQGFLRDTSEGEFASYASTTAEKQRERLWQNAASAAEDEATRTNRPFDEKAFKKTFLEKTPLGYAEIVQAFGPSGDYGKWIRGHNAIAKINGIVFMHGGPSSVVAPRGCTAINSQVRAELQRPLPEGDAYNKSLTFGPDGPLWYRGVADGQVTGDQLTNILRALGAHALVVGHTPRTRGGIKPLLDNRVFPIDTGMLGGTFYPDGMASALEISGDTWTAIYLDHRETLTGPATRSAVPATTR